MKLLFLILKNFGLYINEIIDFMKFEDFLFFLISGKIGFGKIMIFDGMSYVLFGESFGKLCLGKEMCFIFVDFLEVIEVILFFKYNEYFYELNCFFE